MSIISSKEGGHRPGAVLLGPGSLDMSSGSARYELKAGRDGSSCYQ